MPNDDLISFEYKPAKKVIIHSIYKMDYNEFIGEIFKYDMPVNVFWADGFLFRILAIQIDGNPDIMADFLKGILHWEEVIYCKSKKPENLTLKEGAFEVKIIDVSNVYPYSNFVKWLKKIDETQ